MNCYILISGYFLVGSKNSVGKVPGIVSLAVFYSVGLYLLFSLLGVEKFRVVTLVTGYLFPITHGTYWYATVYVVSLFAVPYITALFEVLDRTRIRKFLIEFGVILSVIPTIMFFYVDRIGASGGYSLLWFIYLYFLGGYIRAYDVKPKRAGLVVGFFVCGLFPFAVKVFQQKLLGTEYWDLYQYTSLPVLGSSVCLFLLFLSFRKTSVGWINLVASTTFGVFLFHTQYTMRDKVLWKAIVRPLDHISDTPLRYAAHMLLSVAAIFTVGAIVDLMRIYVCKLVTMIVSKDTR